MSEAITESLLGYEVRRDGIESCVSDIVDSLERNERRKWFACLNPHSYVVAMESSDFQEALKSAHWLVPDGAGIVLASRILGGDIRQRVTGPDIFQGVQNRLQTLGTYSVFFLGSSEEILEAICDRMSKDWPDIQIAGTFSPPFKAEFSDEDTAMMLEKINAARPDVLWVGMTAPKQEVWIHRVLPKLDVRFAAAVGAVFDYYTGNVKRPHPLFRRLGVEWLPRLLQEPRRLWRRTLISAPIFLWRVLLARFGLLR